MPPRRGRRRLGPLPHISSQVQRNLTDQQFLEAGGAIVDDYDSSSESFQQHQEDTQTLVDFEIPIVVPPMEQRQPPNNQDQANVINPPPPNIPFLNIPNHNPPNQHGQNIGNPNHGQIPQGVGRRRTIREVVSRGVAHDPFVHAYPNLIADFEIKGPLIAALPHFAGLDSEDAYGHLHSVFLACTSTKPQGVDIDDVQLKVFHLTLDGKAKEWFRLLPQHDPDALTSWEI